MAIIRVRYKPTAGAGTLIKSRLREHLPSIVCEALSRDTPASELNVNKEDDFELFFDEADPDDICPHDVFIDITADKLPERDAEADEIGYAILGALIPVLAPNLSSDLRVAFYIPSVGQGLWRTLYIPSGPHAEAFAPHSS